MNTFVGIFVYQIIFPISVKELYGLAATLEENNGIIENFILREYGFEIEIAR